MASVVGEAVIGGMTEAAVGSLLSKLSQEVYRIHAFQGDVEALKRQLTILHGFVQSAYYNNNNRMEGYVLEWVENVEDYVFQAERILNDCSWFHHCNDSSSRLNEVLKSPQNVWNKWSISRRLNRISEKLTSMEGLALQHGLSMQQAQPAPPPIEESEVKTYSTLYEESFTVGLDEKLSQFLPLMEAHPRIGVVGMGGVGKTRLLQHVFKHVESRYDLSIWLCISQIYDIKSWQLDILHKVVLKESKLDALSKVSCERRAEEIHKALKEKACLIVLDDVWSSDPTRLEGPLPENDLLKALGLPENVKMLVSTRRSQVVRDLKAYHYQMQHLSAEDSKKLFCLYAFESADFHEPQQDRLLRIIERCHNLPLALKTAARVLAFEYQGNPARHSQVVRDLKAYHYQMQHLSAEDSKKLFCLYAFGSADFHEPQQHILLKIIETCHNLPLALKTTARVLAFDYQGNPARFPLPEEEADDCEDSFGNKDLDPVMRCLKRSYNVLPMDLKRCFAYMAVFPEYHQIDGSKLVKLWMAEGFVSSLQRGRNVVRQLCDRCLLEVLPTEWDDWRISIKYRMHDLVRQLAISIFHSVGGFCQGNVDEFRRALVSKRRVSGGEVRDEFKGGSQLCSLFVYGSQSIANSFWKTVQHLRVLDTNYSIAPCPRKALKHLVYLHMKSADLPDRLRQARSLEYLHIERIERLPDWIGDLSRLAYLYLSDLSAFLGNSYVSAKESLGRLANLIELKTVEIDHGFTFTHLSNLQKLIELRCATQLPLASVEEWTPPPSMQCLWFDNLKGQFNMPESWKVMTNIQCLRLFCVSLTAGCQAFQKLVHLVLENCSGNPPIEIANLPSLTALCLHCFESCSELPEEYGMSGAFPSLKHFVISRFPLLPQLPRIEKGAMRSLRTLQVFWCRNFNFNELPMELATQLLSSEHVRAGWMWQLKSSMLTEVPLRSYCLDCGRHSFGGLWCRCY